MPALQVGWFVWDEFKVEGFCDNIFNIFFCRWRRSKTEWGEFKENLKISLDSDDREEYLTILARLFFVLKCLMHAPSKNASFDCAQMFSSSSFRKCFLLIVLKCLAHVLSKNAFF